MAAFIPHLIFLTTFLHSLAAQRTSGSVSVGASLTATTDGTPWLSPSGEFAFGFQQVQGNENFLLSIWYDKIPDKTIVWYPRNGPMVVQGSKVELTNGLGLVLSDPQGRQVWSSGSISDLAYGTMNDTGNFMLVGSDSRKKWESFNFPADTILPTQSMARNGGFSLFDSDDPHGDCRPHFSPSCDEGYSKDQFDFIELNDIDWPLCDYFHMDPSNAEDCKTSCLKDCFCAVAIYRSDQCWKKKLPLSRKEGYSLNT
ncbi:G-type lectin S-receptor-like serine/threonine-protein kinase LECRK3 [Tanacetum coccineum]|uniref:G-type lectin S-receptor-like serine/threonine-protein kinase LECRK3 n=1 Tax=Tanacetum coccineum TaxID=301880 RepID=A0ABQ5BAV8_9ASTR